MHAASRLRSLATGAASVVVWRVGGMGATFLANIWLARLLGPADFGAFSVIASGLALGCILACAGLNEAGLRFVSEELARGHAGRADAYVRRAFLLGAATSALAVLVVLGSFGIYDWGLLKHLPAAELLPLMALGVASLAAQQMAAEMLRGRNELAWSSLFSGGQAGGALSNLVLVALLAAAAWAGGLSLARAVQLSLASVLVTLPLALAALWLTRRDRPGQDPRGTASLRQVTGAETRQLLAVGGMLMLIQLLGFLTHQADIWIGRACLSEESAGLYIAAKRCILLAPMPVQMAMLTVVSSIPALYVQGRRRELEQLLRGAALVAAVPALAALALLAGWPRWVLSVVFHDEYLGSAAAIRWLAVGFAALVLTGNPVQTLTMTGHQRAALGVTLAGSLGLLIAGPLAARAYGMTGLAAVAGLSLAAQNVAMWLLARRYAGVWTHIGWIPRARQPEAPLAPAETA